MSTQTGGRKTARKSGSKTSRRSSRYTPEEIAQFKANDQALKDRADAALSDPDGRMVATVVEYATTARLSPRFFTYSLRNQALMIQQAEDLGITLSDVGSPRHWRELGHTITDNRPMRIVRPRGRTAAQEDQADSAESTEPEGGEGTDGSEGDSVRFRMMAVYDVSQTDGPEFEPADPDEYLVPAAFRGVDDTASECPQCGQTECDPLNFACHNDAPPTPAEALAYSLRVQLERAGWTLTHEPAAEARADDEARVIYVHDEATPQALRVMADIVARLTTTQNKP
ncbi:hypothetical protein [Hamadaea tsunoensis]|uniref:hypothetical protein n=1 Tax=Hamadaea tsunoensis TaxID=53368 RepID=UPI00042A139A|nr:hypothetical protein [Hamadaea tsunoensis]